MMIRRLNKCGLGSRKIVISRSDSVINFKKRVIELFPKLERVDFEFFQAKLREKHRLEQVVFNSLKDLKAKVKFTLYIKPAQQLINITEGESDEEELPPLFPPRRERQSDDANLTVQASTSDTPDSPRSRQRNSTLSQPGTSGASTTVTSERSNSSSTQITSTLSSPGRNRATVALEGSNTPSSRRGRVIASPVARRSNATPRRTGLSSNSGRQRRRTAIAADDFIHAVVAPEASISPSTRRNRALSSPRVVASRSNVSETTTQAYHTAGTPTVLFRSTAVPTSTEQTATEQYEQLSTPVNPLSLMDVTRDLAVDVNNINAIFEDIPEVGLFGDIGQNECTENFRKKIKEHKELFIHNDSDDPLLMEVRRENPVQDSLAFISISQDDLHSPLRISFTDEDGVDLGGLRREFWSLFLHKISSSVFVTGKPGRQTLRDNFIARTQNIFFHLGQLVALSIIQDGPGLPIFSDIVTDYILLGKPCILNVDDLPEGLKNTIVMMQDCTSEPDLQNMYSGIFDEAVDAGFIIPPSSFKKKHVNILLAALLETQLNKCKKELDQFIKGLDTHQVLSLLKQDVNIACARTLFSGRVKPLTVQTLRNLLKFKYDTGNAALDQRATGQGFLTFLQATKGTSTVINGIDIGPKEVLMWLTGSTAIPAIGFHKPIDVCFGSRTFVNTCALALTLEVRPELAPAEAVKFYSEIIINSQTFTQE
ncbi:uncharacterized protein LOC127730269 isoform X2 [Mytilus californianus]|uniref:uncharacterized protein LOC127730269 isoform X2 n=1 Tax=Mytilus californianus TaxID=6549 RepID=UPI0022469D42|nr:uncharacterized protein LOC127730269 isoform X2 [Mytilus californianus]